MDKDILKQYKSLCIEHDTESERVKEMEKEISLMQPNENEVADTVTKGRHGKKPLGRCMIHGYNDNTPINRKQAKLRERKAKKELHLSQIENMIIDAEEYIYSLNDSELRNLLLFSCVDRKNWKEVAESMGEGYTAEACKQMFSRFMRVK